MSNFYDEEEYFEALKEYEECEAEADRVIAEVFSTEIGHMPQRSITEADIAIMDKRHKAWDKLLLIAQRPLDPS